MSTSLPSSAFGTGSNVPIVQPASNVRKIQPPSILSCRLSSIKQPLSEQLGRDYLKRISTIGPAIVAGTADEPATIAALFTQGTRRASSTWPPRSPAMSSCLRATTGPALVLSPSLTNSRADLLKSVEDALLEISFEKGLIYMFLLPAGNSISSHGLTRD